MGSDNKNNSAQRQALFKEKAKTFSFAAMILGKTTFSKVVVLYEFCRIIDDIADESADQKEARSKLLAIHSDVEIEKSQDPYVQTFIHFMLKENLEKKYVLDLLKGVISDCHEEIRIQSQADLIHYCYSVAGTVGALMCPLLGIKQEDKDNALSAAIHLGIAMQMTNIARDIKEDAENKRIYIPAEWKPHLHDLPFEMLMKKPENDIQDLKLECKKILDLADKYYESARLGYAYLPFRSRLTILLAGSLYQSIGTKIRKNGCRYWKGRQYVSKPHKIFRSFVLLLNIANPCFWKKQKQPSHPLPLGIQNAR